MAWVYQPNYLTIQKTVYEPLLEHLLTINWYGKIIQMFQTTTLYRFVYRTVLGWEDSALTVVTLWSGWQQSLNNRTWRRGLFNPANIEKDQQRKQPRPDTVAGPGGKGSWHKPQKLVEGHQSSKYPHGTTRPHHHHTTVRAMQLRPTPTFTIISQALPQQATYMRKLILKHSLDALVLGTLAVKVLRLGLHQGL